MRRTRTTVGRSVGGAVCFSVRAKWIHRREDGNGNGSGGRKGDEEDAGGAGGGGGGGGTEMFRGQTMDAPFVRHSLGPSRTERERERGMHSKERAVSAEATVTVMVELM